MKYVITGSLGHISRPVVEKLVAAGHEVTVVSSSAERKADIEALGAKAAIGHVDDQLFVSATFAGADAVYLMIPPTYAVADWQAYLRKVGDVYASAVKENGIKQLVVLSSIGAHMGKGAGPVDGLAYLESKLNELSDVNAVYLRPSYFFYNLFQQVNLIKHVGIVTSTQPADHKLILVATSDIADVAAEKLLALGFKGKSVQYIASDDTNTWADIAKVLTEAVGKPGVPYVESTDEQSVAGMLQAGLPATNAEGYLAMGQALRSGEMEADYWLNKDKAVIGKVKLADFAKQFAAAYNAG